MLIMGHMMCKDRLRELGLFCLKKFKQGGDFIPLFNYLTVESKENTAFGRIHRDQTRGNRHKLQQGKFPLGIRNVFIIMKIIKYWKKVSSEAVDGCPSSSLEILRILKLKLISEDLVASLTKRQNASLYQTCS